MFALFLEETQPRGKKQTAWLRVLHSIALGMFLISGASKKCDECPLEHPDFSLTPILEIYSRGKHTPTLLFASGL